MTTDEVREAVSKPLRILPPDWRLPAWRFWAHWSHLLPNQLALAVRLRDWGESAGLRLPEAERVFAFLTDPANESDLDTPGKFFARLSQLVVRATAARRAAERAAAARNVLPAATQEVLDTMGDLPP